MLVVGRHAVGELDGEAVEGVVPVGDGLGPLAAGLVEAVKLALPDFAVPSNLVPVTRQEMLLDLFT